MPSGRSKRPSISAICSGASSGSILARQRLDAARIDEARLHLEVVGRVALFFGAVGELCGRRIVSLDATGQRPVGAGGPAGGAVLRARVGHPVLHRHLGREHLGVVWRDVALLDGGLAGPRARLSTSGLRQPLRGGERQHRDLVPQTPAKRRRRPVRARTDAKKEAKHYRDAQDLSADRRREQAAGSREQGTGNGWCGGFAASPNSRSDLRLPAPRSLRPVLLSSRLGPSYEDAFARDWDHATHGREAADHCLGEEARGALRSSRPGDGRPGGPRTPPRRGTE